MTIKRKPSDARERDLQLALARIQRGRTHTGESKVTIAAVAREAGVSTALIHNHYPTVAEAIREAQGRSSRAQRDVKHQDLLAEREKNRMLRQENEELREKIANLASINEVLMAETRTLKAKQGDFFATAIFALR
ncbi:TetR family transcriptional regulator [Pseudomonas mandelii]|uniref:TetR family transcriptional regulator n=1 Tax=Pseudomonas mandelii TaxID=75612 RepID=A0AB36D5L7_9PSED|nr:TetR family transcriptional regulator [Pseudomonas mandelii]MBU0523851.1 TetR family transcriptional regulator [Gammaproteobacteria bacterium]MBU0820086.1 TetR family transcriptional regulator [Gammaproteobacteria bacterium]MBU0843506.1 TetR family transcriptional regulator [Gammaproteobacteria bacterium]MBU1843075.1 TetR family transcriptional regulator [Gammaproteobacteria bacterium]NMZ83709.1 TetR family transcriptional regulator [Pseudomonas mandelii]